MDWGCRCDLEQTDEEPTDIKGGLQLKIEFQNNPGKTGRIFGSSVYLTSGGLSPEMVKATFIWAREMFRKAIHETRVLYEKAKLKAPYKTVFKSGSASVKVSPFADKVDLKNNIATAKIITEKLGISVKIRPHLNGRIIKYVNNAEYEINGLISDRKAVTTSKLKNLRNTYRSAVDQGCECIVFDLDGTILTIDEVQEEALRKFNTFPKIKEVYIKKGDEIINMKSNL